MAEIQRETILGIDNIPLDLPVAGIGSRTLAAILDYLLLGVGLAIAAFAILAAFGGDAGFSGLAVALVSLVAFALQWGYFAVFEIVLEGRTPGKAAVGLRVIHRDGGSARASSLVVRNVLRAVDLLAAPPMIALDPLSRRLGDWLGSTLVVHARGRPETILTRIPRGWGGEEVQLAERLLARSEELEPDRAAELARRLLAVVAHDDPGLIAGHEGAVQLDPLYALRRLLSGSPPPAGPPPSSEPPPSEPPSSEQPASPPDETSG